MNFFHNSDFDRPERKGHGAKVPWSERAREQVGQGANQPESYWQIRSGERIGPGAKRLGTQDNVVSYPKIFGDIATADLDILGWASSCSSPLSPRPPGGIPASDAAQGE